MHIILGFVPDERNFIVKVLYLFTFLPVTQSILIPAFYFVSFREGKWNALIS